MQNQLQGNQSIRRQIDYSINTISPNQINKLDHALDSIETVVNLSEHGSATSRSFDDIEEFLRSSVFLLLEKAMICFSQLKQKDDMKYDVDSNEGRITMKKLLNHIERLSGELKVQCASRNYRSSFSNAYKKLYNEGSLCYLTEILNSAQEGFTHLYVNREKYLFSREVLEAGTKLCSSFSKIQNSSKDIYNRICNETSPESFREITDSLKASLQEFDEDWANFEKIYINELMLIERDARRFITMGIEIERELTAIETRGQTNGELIFDMDEYNHHREIFLSIIRKINSAANIESKGMDNIALDILLASEAIIKEIPSLQNSQLVSLANDINNSFSSFRSLLRKYEINIEVVDPQLKNNSDLVDVLKRFEENWERGRVFRGQVKI